MTALESALKLELDGKEYYLKQARLNQGNRLQAVFELLADEEQKHAELLELYAKKEAYQLVEGEVYATFTDVFSGMDDFASEIKALPDQIDAYELALEKECEMICLYEEMQEEAKNEQDERLFAFLVEQEQIHYRIFDEIIEHLRRAEQWVEDAEFGVREEY